MAQKYARAPDAYASLKDHAKVDLHNRMCIVVGDDNIEDGLDSQTWRSFWKDHDGTWSESGHDEATLNLGSVLRTVGLSESRYHEYMDLLRKAGGERLTYCDNPFHGNIAEVLVFRSGIVPAGCSATMKWSADPTAPLDEAGSNYVRVRDAGDGWRLILTCT